MPTLLCYNLTGDRAAKIKFTAMRLKIRICDVAQEDYHQPLAALSGRCAKMEGAAGKEDFTDEMLVMAGFSSALMNQLLQTFRQMKIPPVPLKAMLTETNGQWDSCRLHREISAEHEAMTRGGAPAHQGPQA